MQGGIYTYMYANVQVGDGLLLCLKHILKFVTIHK